MEALDERHDAQLLRAVQESVAAWERRRGGGGGHNHTRQKRAEAGVCYDGVGCFRDSGPYGYIDMLPSSPEEVATRFLMYSARKNRRADTPLLDVGFANLTAVYQWAGKAFNVSAPTKIIVHGFGSSCSHVWVYEMRSALMSVEDCNVICVDWENGATFPNYVRAAANARLVGKQLAMLIAGLQEELGLPFNNVHLIGFSLGAHVAGFAGAQLKNLSRITGLDPAGPLFESQDPRARLDSSDAEFVDVIHSNGENLILGGLGSWQPMGHVDFYPNGGRMQKGCSNLFVGAVTDILWSVSEAEGRSLCNHRRAYKFFTDSVSPRCQFPAISCESFDKFLSGNCFPCPVGDNCGNMGYYSDKARGRGTLYLVTRDEEPFCAHQYLARVESTPSVLPVVSYGKIQLTLIGGGDLNETFTLTQKEDEELSVGGALSRIVVPHPAVQEPVAVQILYSAYSGWISSGLARWSIDKIVLKDSFGNSLSVCRRGLVLESGIAAVLPLYPGNCKHLPETSSTSPWSNNVSLPRTGLHDNATTTKYIPTQVVHLGDEIVSPNSSAEKRTNLTTDTNRHEDNYLSAHWQPVPEYPEISGNSGNGLESSSTNLEDVGRGFVSAKQRAGDAAAWNGDKNGTSENNGSLANASQHDGGVKQSDGTVDVAATEKSKKPEPPYKFENVSATASGYNAMSSGYNATVSGYNTTTSSQRPEIKEPILASTTPRSGRHRSPKSDLTPPSITATESWHHWDGSTAAHAKKFKKLNLDASHPSSNETSPERSLVVQLFPQRLVSLLEQAERYARLAFSPFVAPGDTSESRVQRMLKYLPTFWSAATVESAAAAAAKRTNRQTDDETVSDDDAKVALPYKIDGAVDRSAKFHPKFIPVVYDAKAAAAAEEAVVVRRDFNRPEALVPHVEAPVSAENSEYETADAAEKPDEEKKNVTR